MAPQPIRNVAGDGAVLLGRLTPSLRIDVGVGSAGDGPGLPDDSHRRILAAFKKGRGHGVLHLGAREPTTELHPTLAYWRDLGRTFVARVCGSMTPEDPSARAMPGVG